MRSSLIIVVLLIALLLVAVPVAAERFPSMPTNSGNVTVYDDIQITGDTVVPTDLYYILLGVGAAMLLLALHSIATGAGIGATLSAAISGVIWLILGYINPLVARTFETSYYAGDKAVFVHSYNYIGHPYISWLFVGLGAVSLIITGLGLLASSGIAQQGEVSANELGRLEEGKGGVW
jgi:hypothetical protein